MLVIFVLDMLMILVLLVGLVELVMESETLRKIQVKGHGLAGSFNDRTIVEWLQVHNPTELDFRKVSNKRVGIHHTQWPIKTQ